MKRQVGVGIYEQKKLTLVARESFSSHFRAPCNRQVTLQVLLMTRRTVSYVKMKLSHRLTEERP